MDEICQDDQWFEQAFTYMNKHDIPLPNDKKLHFYGLFKQATIGDVNIEKPGLFEFVLRAKYDAWNSFKGLGFRDARNLYIEAVEALNAGWSRQGEYEYIPSPEELKKGDGLSNNAVSTMAVEETIVSDDIFGYTRENNLEKLISAVEEKVDVNSKDEDGYTALHLAADRGYLDIVTFLIDSGADLNIRTNDDESALHLACISEQLEVAKLLISRGIDTTLVDAEGLTAFEQADDTFVKGLK
ncbi:ankyrin repeat-containing domain protein [Mucor mucedo]|uniref:ACB domain-containing protein n=1 Tax=Mucor saturninus TaxID=64648 RepID=A0A8H7QT56_9FUNG|nr:ankyrin repeat-containing domain protein [Mucor mucedo]KAG2198314.1 hypothetical protein INT47_003027 [Mucor saturninus]KAI7873092.1 ankyrin repeat-containing domain protein [Mucor mucedo]